MPRVQRYPLSMRTAIHPDSSCRFERNRNTVYYPPPPPPPLLSSFFLLLLPLPNFHQILRSRERTDHATRKRVVYHGTRLYSVVLTKRDEAHHERDECTPRDEEEAIVSGRVDDN